MAHRQAIPPRACEAGAQAQPARRSMPGSRRGCRCWCCVVGYAALSRRHADRRRIVAADRPHGRCAATSGCRPAKCWRSSKACAARTSSRSARSSGRQKLLSSPWVESATIRRVLPSTVEITVHERRPMGIGRIGTAMYLIDGEGVIVDEYGPAYADIDLPIIDGLATSPRDGGRSSTCARAEFAARVIARAGGAPGDRQARLADRRRRPARRGRDPRRRSGAAAARRHRFRGAAAAVHRPGAGAARAAGGDRLRGFAVRRTVVRAPGEDGGEREAVRNRKQDRRTRGTTGTVRGGSRHRDLQGLHRGRRAARRRRRRCDRHRRHRLEGAEARRRRQPRGGGRIDQEVDRGSGADGRRRGRLGAAGDQRAAHQGLQQPRRRGGGRQEPRGDARRRAARDRCGARGVAAGRARDSPRAAAGLRRRRAGRHRRAGRTDRRAARSQRAHHHRQPDRDAEPGRVRQSRRRRGDRTR